MTCKVLRFSVLLIETLQVSREPGLLATAAPHYYIIDAFKKGTKLSVWKIKTGASAKIVSDRQTDTAAEVVQQHI